MTTLDIVAGSAPAQIDTQAIQRADDLLMSAAWVISTASRTQGKEVDRLQLHDAVKKAASRFSEIVAVESDLAEGESVPESLWQGLIQEIALESGVEGVELYETPDPARLPAITWVSGVGWGVIRTLTAQNKWLVDLNGSMLEMPTDLSLPCLRFQVEGLQSGSKARPVFELFKKQFLSHKKTLIEAACAGALINLLAIITSLYSMQIYDRVIPTQGYSTLFVLTLGVVIALFFDLLIKVSRSYLMDGVVVNMDSRLSRAIVGRLLSIRLDQLPSSVGSLSAQLRGYETVRAFLSTSTFYLMVDLPFSLLFIAMIMLIGSPLVALVPLIFFAVAIGFGLVMRGKVDSHAAQGTAAGNLKTGLLVEAIEGAETIKSGAGNWGVLSKWIDITAEAMHHEMALRSLTEKSGYLTGLLQQASYIGLIAVGAYWAAEGNMTMGSLIACSILSGRALAAISQIPGLIVQGAHSKAALDLLEKVFAYEVDNHGMGRPLVPQSLLGNYDLELVRFAYQGSPKALIIKNLSIRAGEKIGVLGPVGSGKSTLLRLLSGMYRANEGRILLDGLDLDQISRQFLGEKIGYLQQDHRLFSGTLRENLLIGIPDPGDHVIKQAAAKTGLLSAISSHPKGLDMMIAEGGKGLSGGQRQLVAFTRLLISHPSIWLLDEPTASMDSTTEKVCIAAMRGEIRPEDTLLIVTHKASLLPLVDRLIVVANHRILIDGPRDEVLSKLSNKSMESERLA